MYLKTLVYICKNLKHLSTFNFNFYKYLITLLIITYHPTDNKGESWLGVHIVYHRIRKLGTYEDLLSARIAFKRQIFNHNPNMQLPLYSLRKQFVII